MTEYTLRLTWRVYAPNAEGQHAVQEREGTFPCTVENGQLLIPADAQRIIHKRGGSLGTTSMGWVGEQPKVFKCGALTEDQAAELSKKANDLAEIAMNLLDQTEPLPQEGIDALIGPREGPVKIIGEADYKHDVPLLTPNRWGDPE